MNLSMGLESLAKGGALDELVFITGLLKVGAALADRPVERPVQSRLEAFSFAYALSTFHVGPLRLSHILRRVGYELPFSPRALRLVH